MAIPLVYDVHDAPSRSHCSCDDLLVQIADAYFLLKDALDATRSVVKVLDSTDAVPEHNKDVFRARTESIGEHMHALAVTTISIKAQLMIGIAAKARILADWVGHENGDLVDGLATSLCRDISHVASPSVG
jgi:hypothetical protein